MNKFFITGRIAQAPEVTTTQSGIKRAVVNVAVRRPAKDKTTGEYLTDFFRLTAWRTSADYCEKNLHVGDLVEVEASVFQYKYTDKNGQNRTGYDFPVNNISKLVSKTVVAGTPVSAMPEQKTRPVSVSNGVPAPAAAQQARNPFEELEDDDELPF